MSAPPSSAHPQTVATFDLAPQVALAEAHGSGGTREIRAVYDDRVVRVYQAYNAEIAAAVI